MAPAESPNGNPEAQRALSVNPVEQAARKQQETIKKSEEVRNVVVRNAAEAWSRTMQEQVLPGMLKNAQDARAFLPAQFNALPQAKVAITTMLDALVTKTETAIKSIPPNAYPVFFALEQMNRALSEIVAPPQFAPALTQLNAFVRDMLSVMNVNRPPAASEAHRNNPVDQKQAQVVRLTFTVLALGGFLTTGLITLLGGKDLVNKNALALYAGLLSLPFLGRAFSGAPGSDALMNALRQVQFLGEPGGRFEQLGLRGKQWTPVARGIFRMRSELGPIASGNKPFDAALRTKILALSPDASTKARLTAMMDAKTAGKPDGQPMRDLIGLLLSATDPGAERVVIEYFENDAGPHQMQQFYSTVSRPAQA